MARIKTLKFVILVWFLHDASFIPVALLDQLSWHRKGMQGRIPENEGVV